MNEAVSGFNDGADIYHRIDPAVPLSTSLIGELNGLCDRVESAGESAIAVVHLLGDPDRAASPWPGDVGIHVVTQWERVLRRMERLAAVTVAVAEGYCAGCTLEVLLTADYRIGTRGTRLRLPVTSGEFWPGMALHRLANQIGVARARRLVLFGEELGSAQAVRLGLLDELVEEVADGVTSTAWMAYRSAGSELGIRRRLLLEAPATSFEEALGAHLAACDRTLRRARRYPADAGAEPA